MYCYGVLQVIFTSGGMFLKLIEFFIYLDTNVKKKNVSEMLTEIHYLQKQHKFFFNLVLFQLVTED